MLVVGIDAMTGCTGRSGLGSAFLVSEAIRPDCMQTMLSSVVCGMRRAGGDIIGEFGSAGSVVGVGFVVVVEVGVKV
jgi:hypothetical protein